MQPRQASNRVQSLFSATICMAVGYFIAPISLANDTFQVHRSEKTLTCGNVTLNALTEYILWDDPDTVIWLNQTLTLRDVKNNLPQQIKLDSKKFKQPFYHQSAVLDAFIDGWTCLQTKSGQQYIYMSYTCVPSTLRPRCTADESGNWSSVLDLGGKKVKSSRFKKLGILDAIGDSIKLQPAAGK
jgi:hypothetical protein